MHCQYYKSIGNMVMLEKDTFRFQHSEKNTDEIWIDTA